MVPPPMTQPRSTNIRWEPGAVTRAEREARRGHRGATLWFTGLSGSGKSTLAHALDARLSQAGCVSYTLDGDNIRHGLNGDLGFSPTERTENIRRTGEVARLFTDAGVLVLCAFISPYRVDRDGVRALLGPGDFIEIHVDASLAACEARDVKGLYRKARAGEIRDFTGLDAPYEAPLRPELVLDTEAQSLEQSIEKVLGFLQQNGYVPEFPS
jgi:adenylylsulfate kinase